MPTLVKAGKAKIYYSCCFLLWSHHSTTDMESFDHLKFSCKHPRCFEFSKCKRNKHKLCQEVVKSRSRILHISQTKLMEDLILLSSMSNYSLPFVENPRVLTHCKVCYCRINADLTSLTVFTFLIKDIKLSMLLHF